MFRRAFAPPVVCLLAIVCAASACRATRVKKIGTNVFVDDVPEGKASPHLYWLRDGKYVVVDRQIQSYHQGGGCIIYETSRSSAARVLYGFEPGKTPVAAAASDAFRPWHFAYDGARRFELPNTDADGRTTLSMDVVRGYRICELAYAQPPFHDDWAVHDPQDFSRVPVERTDFDVNGADTVGNSVLSQQVQERNPDVVAELIRAGADVNTANDAGITPLMTAVAFVPKGTEILRLLLDAHAVVDARDDRGMTALMHAAQYGRREAVLLLLERGANAMLTDRDGRTAAAMTGNSPEAAELTVLLERAAATHK
jgi:ankyrin repeat protein